MKKLLLLFVWAAVINASAQSFEGKIVYKNSYKSKSDIPDKQLSTLYGTTTEYLFRNGDYKTIANGKMKQWELYVNKENKLYSKAPGSETVLWNDGGYNEDEVIGIEVNKGVAEVLGHKCDEIVFTCKNGTQKYYYSSQFPLDPNLFEKHKFGNWAEYTQKSKAVPLKIVIDNPDFFMESTAVDIKPMPLDDKTFQLAGGMKIERNP